MSDNDHPPGSSLSRDTTPTWEMELLISGVTVFALLQLPGVMDQAYLAFRPRLDTIWDEVLRFLFIYSKMGVLLLAIAFVLHLTLRGYWIALVGMHSIYPDGVRWDRLRIGPIQRRLIERHGIRMADRIEAADNRSSIVFALGVTLALVMAGIVLIVTLSFALASLLAWLFGWHWLIPNGAFILLGLLVLPYALTHQFDRHFGARLPADGSIAQTISRIYGFYARFGYGSDRNPTMKLLQSHVGERKVLIATFTSIFLVGVILTFQLFLQRENISVGDYARWPDAEAGLADSLIEQHYRDQSGQTDTLLPTIDSMFPRGNYLSLLVPFNPKRHPALLANQCRTTWQAATDPAQRAPLLECMARLQQFELDGQPLVAPSLRYFSDPRTEQQGVILVVPIAGLTPGEHVLSLNRAPRIDAEARDEGPSRYQIAFWK